MFKPKHPSIHWSINHLISYTADVKRDIWSHYTTVHFCLVHKYLFISHTVDSHYYWHQFKDTLLTIIIIYYLNIQTNTEIYFNIERIDHLVHVDTVFLSQQYRNNEATVLCDKTCKTFTFLFHTFYILIQNIHLRGTGKPAARYWNT